MKIRRRLFNTPMAYVLLAVAVLAGLVPLPAWSARPVVTATQIDLIGPPGSGIFGESVTVLPSGNIVVTDPYYDSGTTADVGAVYLYNGATGALISTLTGSTVSDWVGSGGVTALSNGNYVVRSPFWDNGAAWDAGAVTWGSGATGISGPVSAANSLVGGTGGDQVGCARDNCYPGVTVLNNGNYVVCSSLWDSSSAWDVGAVTWGNGTSGTKGVVAVTNSLVGSQTDDKIGERLTALSNGNYVVGSRYWNNGGATDAGAMTWGNGVTGVKGVVSVANSLVGSQTDDWVGYSLTALSNGNYLAHSPYWDNGGSANAGAVTWGNGVTGVKGVVSVANSLVGSRPDDLVGYGGGTALSNGNYVVRSFAWDNGAVANAGAATWGNGVTGVKGVISVANSLVGSTANDRVGDSVRPLSNGNYVVSSPAWSNGGAAWAGAATWGDGTSGISGVVSAANSLVHLG